MTIRFLEAVPLITINTNLVWCLKTNLSNIINNYLILLFFFIQLFFIFSSTKGTLPLTLTPWAPYPLFFQTGSHFVAKADLNLVLLLPQCPG